MEGPFRGKGNLPFLRLLPNLVTMLGLCAGLTSIRFVMAGRFELAAGLIILAAVLDALDGRLARRLKATSEFGGELDSLADFLNFGVAPGILVFEYMLNDTRAIGWIFVLLYVSCCCLRLARFNVTRDDEVPEPGTSRKTHFVGVPAPAGAMMVLLPVFLGFEDIFDGSSAPLLTSLYVGLIGAAMVSTFHTFSLKSIYVPRSMIKWVLIGAPVVAGVMLTQFWTAMIQIDLAYAAVLVASVLAALKNRRKTPSQ